MLAIGRARGAGKTHKLITEYFLNSDCLLLVISEQERRRIINEYELSPADQRRVFSWGDNIKERLRGLRGDILIDNADLFLLGMLYKNPRVITFTGRSE